MNRKQFFDLYAERMGVSKTAAETSGVAFLELLDECFNAMEDGESINFYGFGTFKKKHYASRTAGDLLGGGRTVLPESSRIVFKRSYTKKN